jgi:hypothetical protein
MALFLGVPMIYIVSGAVRSGTSMMMRALHAGGMDAHWDDAQEKRLREKEAYSGNPQYYEMTMDQVPIDFPRQLDGRLIKLLFNAPANIVAHEYHVIVMLRNEREIIDSHRAAFPGILPEGVSPQILRAATKEQIGILKMRRDVKSIHLIDYASMLARPRDSLMLLREHGWPITDMDKAVATVRPDLRRFNYEPKE